MTEQLQAHDDGVIDVNGKPYLTDAKGALVPLETIKPIDKLEDEVVRKVMRFAGELSDQIARFRGHTMTDLGEFDALLAQEYNVKKGGPKGNRTYQSFDGLLKVEVKVADFIDFGPQLQVAKRLLDECLTEWSADSRPEIRAVITRAFNTDKEGQVNRSEIFMLLRLDIEDPRWQEAMRAIREAMRVTGSKEYVRFHRRARVTDRWQAVTIDLARAS
jgi:hypothetical protein